MKIQENMMDFFIIEKSILIFGYNSVKCNYMYHTGL